MDTNASNDAQVSNPQLMKRYEKKKALKNRLYYAAIKDCPMDIIIPKAETYFEE